MCPDSSQDRHFSSSSEPGPIIIHLFAQHTDRITISELVHIFEAAFEIRKALQQKLGTWQTQ